MKALTINGIGKYYNFFLFFGLSLLFFGCSNILSLQGYLIVLGASMLYVSCLLKGAFKPSKYFWLLVCFCVSYAIFSFLSGDRTVRSLISAFSYSIFVPIGISLPIFQDPTNVKLRKGIIWSMAAGLAVSAFFTVLATYLYAGRDLGDILITFWDEESTVRTGIQLYFIPLFSISLAYFFGWKRSLHSATYWVGFIGFAIFDIFVLYFSLEIGNRAIFVSFVALFLYVLIRIINTAKSRTFKITFFVFLSIVLIVALGLFLGILPVPDFLANIPVIERFLNGGSNNRRLSLYIDFIQNFWKYPFGGTFHDIKDVYVHNFILDIYTFGGIIPFAFFLVLLFLFFKNFKYLNSNAYLHDDVKFLLVGIFFLGMFEPLFQANPLYISFVLFLFNIGFSACPTKIYRRTLLRRFNV